MAQRITVKVPVRIDLAGGWTDVPTYCNLHRGQVVNIAINHFVHATSFLDDERKMEVSYGTEMPTGCGLGTAGAMNVAPVAGISSAGEGPAALAEKAYQIEAVLGNKGGRQDQWASAFGGVQNLIFEGENVVREPLNPSAQFTTWLQENLLLFDTHLPHVSGDLHQAIWWRFSKGEKEVERGLAELAHAAEEMAQSIKTENKAGVESALKRVMMGTDMLDRKLHDPFREVLQPLEGSGHVAAWKAMGAGGGGVVGVLQHPTMSQTIIDAAQKAGWTQVIWNVDWKGVERTVENKRVS